MTKTPPELFLCHARLAPSPPVPGAAWNPALPAVYRERLARMRSESARRRTLAGLWLLREAALRAGWKEPDLSRLTRNHLDRPLLPDGPAFSISHCGDLVACVLADRVAVGLDVERVRPFAVARFARFLSSAEVAAAERDPLAFFAAWTAREAVVKAEGRVGLSRIARVRVDADQAELDGERLFLQRPELGDGCVACLATDRPVAPAVVATLPAPPV